MQQQGEAYMKKKTSVMLPIILFIGLSLLLYPTISNYWNSLHQSKAIAGYVDKVAQISEDEYNDILTSAKEYNKAINRLTVSALTDAQREDYMSQLNLNKNGMLGYIEIPKINCTLPIYHTTETSVLQIAVGHVEGSSLPVGGEGSHCVLSGHRGLTSAKLFTNLDQLAIGDVFVLSVLNEKLSYEVDDISIVDPEDVSKLTFEDGKDLCTLVTCTPYGVNSHRLLVRGHRVENTDVTMIKVSADATQVNALLVNIIAFSPIILLGIIILVIRKAIMQRL
jgi:sortase A